MATGRHTTGASIIRLDIGSGNVAILYHKGVPLATDVSEDGSSIEV